MILSWKMKENITHVVYVESNSIVMYLRLLTSAQMRLAPEDFAPFLFHPEIGEPMEIVPFCENFVESVGKEAGMTSWCIRMTVHLLSIYT